MEVWCKDRAFGTAMVRPRVIQEGVRVNHRRKLDESIGRVYGPQGRTASGGEEYSLGSDESRYRLERERSFTFTALVTHGSILAVYLLPPFSQGAPILSSLH
ncbi:hypothetical protein YC2023_072064 [Brassica napus]